MEVARVVQSAVALALLTAATATLIVAGAAPAAAHGRGSDATNFSSQITAVPQIEGVSWRVYGGDEFLSVTNVSDAELTVLGYDGEPYARIGPDGVYVNVASRAAYLNADRYAQVASIPADVGVDQPPRWERRSGGNSYAWHDHRVHWMAPTPPPVVAGATGPTLVQPWQVPFVVAGEAHVVAGELLWVPAPSALPWLALAVLLVLPALAGLRHGDSGRWRARWARPAAAVLAFTAALNATHLVDDLIAAPLPAPTRAVAAGQTLLFLAIAGFGALRAWQGRDGAFTALGVGSGALFVGQGLLYITVLASSQTTSVFPDAVARGIVALSLVQFPAVGAVAYLGNRRLGTRSPPTPQTAPA